MEIRVILFSLIGFLHAAYAGESALITTYQPLDGLGSDSIYIVSVTCHDWNGHAGQASSIQLISAKNVPPTNNPKEATEDLNLASVCGVHFYASDLGDPEAPLELIMDVTKFSVPKRFGHSPEEIVRACLECLRLAMPDKLRKTPLTFRAVDKNAQWVGEIVRQFNAHDRKKVFHTPAR